MKPNPVTVSWTHYFLLALKSVLMWLVLAAPWIIGYVALKISYWYFITPIDRFTSFPFSLLQFWISKSIFQASSPFVTLVRTGHKETFFSLKSPILDVIFGSGARQRAQVVGGYGYGGWIDIFFLLMQVTDIVFPFIVFVSFLVPLIRYLMQENNLTISWIRSYILAFKIAIVGFVLALLFTGVAFFSLGGTVLLVIRAPSVGDMSALLGSLFFALISFIVFSVLANSAIGATLMKFTAQKALGSSGVSWARSFLVSLKASVIAFFMSIIIGAIGLVISAALVLLAIGSSSAAMIVVWLVGVIVILIITAILLDLAPIASLIKYITEDLKKLREES